MTDPAAAHRELLERLAELARQTEAHRTAIWLLEQQRLQVREQLVHLGWQPPEATR